MSAQLNKRDWDALLRKLSAGEIPDSEIGSAIVHLSKPPDRQRVVTAKAAILRYLNHHNSWARHEAMWFINWARFHEEKSALIEALKKDRDPDNRGFAALCLAHLMNGTADSESLDGLKATVLNDSEDASVRLNAYGALLEIATNRSGFDFYSGEKNFNDVDWAWVSNLE